MRCTVTVNILVALLAQVNAKDSSENLGNSLLDRALKMPAHHEGLDQVTLGKPGHLALSRTSATGPLSSGVARTGGVKAQARPGGRLPVASGPAWDRSIAGHAARFGSAAESHFQSKSSPLQRTGVVARVSRPVAEAPVAVPTGTEFQVSQEKPIGVTWTKGPDGGIYASKVDKNADPRIQLGDKLMEVSASFGNEMWPANSYANSMMAIQTRIGPVFMKILSRGGDTDVFKQEATRSGLDQERAAGNYGAGTNEFMRQRFKNNKKTEKERLELFNDGVSAFQAGDYEKAKDLMTEVRDLEPQGYMGDNFERVTEYYKVASFNLACCYSMLGKEQAGLAALNDAMNSGWDDFNKIRTDEYLAFLRKSPDFEQLLERYDEPIFNTEILKQFKLPFR